MGNDDAPSKGHGWVDYRARMARVQQYMHDHLREPLDLQRLADVAHLSPFHWHRVYTALHGESAAHTVRRLRLHQASGELANGRDPVARIALRCGYPSVQSFSRAFQALYGMCPSAFRAHGQHQGFRAAMKAQSAHAYTVEVRKLPAVQLAVAPQRGSYMKIGRAFETAWRELCAAGLAAPASRWIAIYYDDPLAVPTAQLFAQAGLSVAADASLPPLLAPAQVGGCTCAVLRFRGPYAGMRAAYEWLFGTWLVQSGLPAGDQPVFEEYLNHPSQVAPCDLLTDICLPLAESAQAM